MKIGIVVLAAGASTRFGENKLLKELRGRPILEWVLSALPEEYLETALVVTQYEAAAVLAKVRGIASLLNETPEEGISRSIHIGTKQFHDCDGILYVVGDQPLLTRESLQRLIAAWRETPDRIVIAAHGEMQGNPCLFPREFFPELSALKGDRGGKTVVKKHPDRVRLIQLPEQELWDCDTAEEYARLRQAAGKEQAICEF